MKTEVKGLNRADLNLWTNDCRNLKIPELELQDTSNLSKWLTSSSYNNNLDLSINLTYRIPERYRYLIGNPCSEIFISTPGKTFDSTWNTPSEYVSVTGSEVQRDKLERVYHMRTGWPGNDFKTGESKKMSKFEMKTYINGTDAKHMGDGDLINCIVDAEAEVKALKKINTISDKVADKIEVLEEYLESVADYLDNRGGENV